ncbi:hypothetical protein GCM10029992_44230 [Glycomyces albus]
MARTALTIARTLRGAGIIAIDDAGVKLTVDLPDHFALNQPLAPFALAALDLLDPESDTHPMDIVSIIEATLEGPGQILAAQRNKAKGEAVAAMKADGLDYYDRMNRLDDDEIDYPKPLADLLGEAFDAYRLSHPWAADYQLEPKSILREIWEGHMTFGEYISTYALPAPKACCCATSPAPTKPSPRPSPNTSAAANSTTSPPGSARPSAKPTPP